jgi:hypothetical protein
MENTHQIKIERTEEFVYRYSICTLMTNKKEYAEMRDSFKAAGFSDDICEYLYIDNEIGNTYDAYAGINRFLRAAKGQYIILCHQDILLYQDRIDVLDRRINEMDHIDPKWGILANAGGVNLKYVAMHVTQNNGNLLIEKLLPLKLSTVDENFILVKNNANLALSSDLSGFHMYGTDICLIAKILGYNAYVIDFRLLHKSDGNADQSFYRLKKELKKKYLKAFTPHFISTTITRFYISGNTFGYYVFNSGFFMFLARQYYKFFKPKKLYHKNLD